MKIIANGERTGQRIVKRQVLRRVIGHARVKFAAVAPLIKFSAIQYRQAGLVALVGAIHAKGVRDRGIAMKRHYITGRMLLARLPPNSIPARQPNGARIAKTAHAVEGAEIVIK